MKHDRRAAHHVKDFTNKDTENRKNGRLSQVPVAICDIGVRLPGGVRSDSGLFELLINKRYARSAMPAEHYKVDAFYEPRGKPDFLITRHGYYIVEDLARIDASMSSIFEAGISQMNPGQRLLLEIIREAFKDASESDFRDKNIKHLSETSPKIERTFSTRI